MNALRGRVVILTGATGGFGRALARALAAEDADLVLTARDPRALEELAAGLGPRPARVRTIAADLTEEGAADAIVRETLRGFGTIHALINNAGVLGPVGPAWEVDEAAWWRAVETNLRGTLRACRAALPAMTARGHGRIVNVASSAGRTRWPLASAYAVSKAATIKLTENLAQESARHGVSVFAYHPGLLNTGLTHGLGPELAQPRSAPVTAWVRRQVLTGATTPLSVAATTLIRLLDGTADALTGRYLTAHDDLAALAKANGRMP